MGYDADAYIAYGIPLKETETPPNLTNEQWETELEKWDNDETETRGYDIIRHGYCEEPQYLLAIPGTQQTSWYGDAKPIKPLTIQNEETRHKWRTTMHKLGLNTEPEGWYLLNYLSH